MRGKQLCLLVATTLIVAVFWAHSEGSAEYPQDGYQWSNSDVPTKRSVCVDIIKGRVGQSAWDNNNGRAAATIPKITPWNKPNKRPWKIFCGSLRRDRGKGVRCCFLDLLSRHFLSVRPTRILAGSVLVGLESTGHQHGHLQQPTQAKEYNCKGKHGRRCTC